MSMAAQLQSGLQAMALPLPAEAQAQLVAYLELLKKWNKTYNLTAIDAPERMVTHHLLDSLAVLPHVPVGGVLDVGAGAGLPGIPLAIANPALTLTLIDASTKKAAFMRQAVIALGLSNVTVHAGRVEDLTGQFAGIVSRAFSSLADFVAVTRHLLAPGGQWLAMKGRLPAEELAALNGVAVVQQIVLAVPNLGAERHLIVMANKPLEVAV
jgi:16S rRNA (guanine527-N7)-methyltransferase